MDPISVVGLVASSIQLTDTMAKASSYVNDVKDAPTERAQFARHASSLLALLVDLRYRVEEAEVNESDPWFSALKGLSAKDGTVCEEDCALLRAGEGGRKNADVDVREKEVEGILAQ